MARGPRGADLADDGKDQILGVDPLLEAATDVDLEVADFRLHQCLGCQHVLNVRSPNALGQGGERAMGRGVGVAADDGHARQRGTLLGPHHVDDALARVEHLELPDAVSLTVLVQGDHLLPRD